MALLNHYGECIKVLVSLHKEHPSFTLGRHLATALSDYGDIWGISDKEMLFALKKYQSELGMTDDRIVEDEYVNKVIKDGMNLDTILDDDDEQEEY